MKGKPQAMFAEMDGQLPYGELQLDEPGIITHWHTLMSRVSDNLQLKLNPKLWRWTSASKGTKLSLHVVYCGEKSFKDCTDQLCFWQYVHSVASKDFPWLCGLIKINYKGKDDTYRWGSIIDLSVYTSNRAMRTIYSHKHGSDRKLIPFKMKDNTMKKLGAVNIQEYFVYRPNDEDFYNINYPEYDKLSSKNISYSDIKNIILKHVPNTEIREFAPPLIKLKNAGTRTCLINGEDNISDNSYVVWRRSGLYFKCHDEGCKDQEKCIYEFKKDIIKPVKAIGGFSTEKFIQRAKKVTTRKELNELCDDILKHMNLYFTYIKGTKSFAVESYSSQDPDTLEIIDEYMFKNLSTLSDDWANQNLIVHIAGEKEPTTINVYKLWRGSRKRITKYGIRYNPRSYLQPKYYDENYYNLFDGWSITETSDMSLTEDHAFFKHILHRWCHGNMDQYNFVLDWFSHLIQRPWIKMGSAIVLQGTEGTGKGCIIDIVKDIIGEKYFCHPTSADDVLGSFNSLLFGKSLCFVDEMVWGGDKQKAGVIKKLVTEKSMTINKKNIPKISVTNLMNIILASNEHWVVPAGHTARRFLILVLSQDLLHATNAQDEIDAIRSIDRQQLANFFYNRDLTNFNDRKPPMTEGLRDQKINTFAPIYKWWLDWLNSGSGKEVIFDSWCDKTLMFESYISFSNDRHINETGFWRIFNGIAKNLNTRRGPRPDRLRQVYIPDINTMRNTWRYIMNDKEWPFSNL
jgi:hypothetical protein